ncbi:MAG: hypothetical protein KKE73_00405 [Proteobacteria bacterium]|nr:hypothetical protein [Pseudomonadota bacterium]
MSTTEKINAITQKHHLSVVHNPEGGLFTCTNRHSPLCGFNCQLALMDEDKDLAILEKAIGDWLSSQGSSEPCDSCGRESTESDAVTWCASPLDESEWCWLCDECHTALSE